MPIGVIDASWGGAPLAAFTPLTTIASDPALQPAILHWSRMADRQAATLLEIEKEKREIEAAAARGPDARPGAALAFVATGPRGLVAGRDLQRDGRAAGSLRRSRADHLVSGREQRRSRPRVRHALRDDDPRLARALGPGRLPVPVGAARELHAAPRRARRCPVGRAARRADADPRPAQHGPGGHHRHRRGNLPTSTRATSATWGCASRWRPRTSPTAMDVASHRASLYESATVEGGKVRVRFSHVHGGLEARGRAEWLRHRRGRPQVRPRRPRIDGTTVVVSSPKVAAPVGALRVGEQPEGQPVRRRRPPGVPVPLRRVDPSCSARARPRAGAVPWARLPERADGVLPDRIVRRHEHDRPRWPGPPASGRTDRGGGRGALRRGGPTLRPRAARRSRGPRVGLVRTIREGRAGAACRGGASPRSPTPRPRSGRRRSRDRRKPPARERTGRRLPDDPQERAGVEQKAQAGLSALRRWPGDPRATARRRTPGPRSLEQADWPARPPGLAHRTQLGRRDIPPADEHRLPFGHPLDERQRCALAS